MVKSILTIIKSAPYGREDAFAGLRFSLSQLAAGMLDHCDTILVEDGVYNAVLGQQSDVIRMPSNLEATEDLFDLDGRVLCVFEHMEAREISRDEILEDVEVVPIADLPEIIEAYDAFVTY